MTLDPANVRVDAFLAYSAGFGVYDAIIKAYFQRPATEHETKTC
jgi:hypothetical protein